MLVLWCAEWPRSIFPGGFVLRLRQDWTRILDCDPVSVLVGTWTSVTDLFMDCDDGCVMWSVDLFLDRRKTEYVTMPGPPARSIFSGGLVLRMRGDCLGLRQDCNRIVDCKWCGPLSC